MIKVKNDYFTTFSNDSKLLAAVLWINNWCQRVLFSMMVIICFVNDTVTTNKHEIMCGGTWRARRT